MLPTSLRRPCALSKIIHPFLFAQTSHVANHIQRCAFFSSTPRRRSSRTSDPLRILFCGSDAFSCESLKALHREHEANRRLVESLEVMVLPGKRTGRGLKQIREVPCKALAEELGLRIHQRKTFRQWDLPPGTNLIVVVSFGLFVPKRILNSAKYGGLNVHPSLLPDLRGPAPIHHALLRGASHTGISLQTLDATAFDHGTVLSQTPAPGIPIPPSATLDDFRAQMAVKSAEMLVQGLRDGLHVPPLVDAGWKAAALEQEGQTELIHAPKVDKSAARIAWDTWGAEEWIRRLRVLGSVWTNAIVSSGKHKGHARRVLFMDAEALADEGVAQGDMLKTVFAAEDQQKLTVEVIAENGSRSCLLKLPTGAWMRVRRVKVEGSPEQDAAVAFKPFQES